MAIQLNSLHGTVLRSSAAASFILTETAYAPRLRLPRHDHQNAYFCFTLQGVFTEAYGNRMRTCRASTLLFHPAGEIHSDHFHSRVRCFNLQLDSRVHRQIEGLNQPADFSGGALTCLATKLYREFREMDELSGLVIEGIALELVGTAARSAKASRRACPPWLARARELLHENFADRLTVADVASEVGVHETHLAREFRRYYRCTIGDFVRRRRVEFACRQISTSDAPLSEIAVAAGFFDQSHFGRTFKLLTGMSPAAYRETFRAR
ncbi:MAG TPA: AraC family transcriptional regulator [Pyrinomonadaceae bacterium]